MSQVLGIVVMLLAVGASIACFKKGRRKAGLAIIVLLLALIVGLTVMRIWR